MAALRVTVKTRGCAGNFCALEYTNEKEKLDEEVQAHGAAPPYRHASHAVAGIKVFVEGKSIMKIMVRGAARHAATDALQNATMDYTDGDLSSGFVFENPQAKAVCGCGESFFS